MFKRVFLLIAFFSILFSSSSVFASRGVIAFYGERSDILVIRTQSGYYTCGEVFGLAPWNLSRGDIVMGDLDSFGFHDVYDYSIDESFQLFIDEIYLNEQQAAKWIQSKV